MALLLDAVQTFFELILAMGDETRVLTCPCWVRGPLIIENRVTELITAAASLKSFLYFSLAMHTVSPSSPNLPALVEVYSLVHSLGSCSKTISQSGPQDGCQ